MTYRIPSWRRHFDDLQPGDQLSVRLRVSPKLSFGAFQRLQSGGPGKPWRLVLETSRNGIRCEHYIDTRDVAGINVLSRMVDRDVECDAC